VGTPETTVRLPFVAPVMQQTAQVT